MAQARPRTKAPIATRNKRIYARRPTSKGSHESHETEHKHVRLRPKTPMATQQAHEPQESSLIRRRTIPSERYQPWRRLDRSPALPTHHCERHPLPCVRKITQSGSLRGCRACSTKIIAVEVGIRQFATGLGVGHPLREIHAVHTIGVAYVTYTERISRCTNPRLPLSYSHASRNTVCVPPCLGSIA